MAAQPVSVDTTEADRKALLRKAYAMATSSLRENHHDEFLDLQVKAAKDLGIEWEPRLSPAQRAVREFDALIAEHPFLKDRLAPAEESTTAE